MKKKLIRLTENDLHRIVENSVKRVIKEYRWEIGNDSRGLDTNFYNKGIEGFDDEDDLDDDYDDSYKPLDGNLSFDNERDYYTSNDMDDSFDDSKYFEGGRTSDSENFYSNPTRTSDEREYEENNEVYKNPKKEINNRLKRIKNGEPIEKVFNVTRRPSRDIYTIEFNNKFNLIDAKTGKLLSDTWFHNMKIDYYDRIVGMIDTPKENDKPVTWFDLDGNIISNIINRVNRKKVDF